MKVLAEVTPMSEAEVERWQSFGMQVGAAVLVPRVVQGRLDPNGGSGVLVRICRRDFVLTAGHVVCDEATRKPVPKTEIAVQFPRDDGLFLGIKPGEMIAEFCATYEPDVAVIELDAKHAVYWRNHAPITLERIASAATLARKERFLVFGVPGETTTEGPSGIEPVREGNVVTMRREVTTAAVPVVTFAYRNVVNEHAPADGRCFHVGWDHFGRHGEAEPQRIKPHGVSGGAVLAVDREPIQLVGLVRSTFRDKYLLCEPILPALRLLMAHPDAGVRDEVLAAVVRLEASTP